MNVLDPKLYAKHVDIETEWNLKEIIITFKQKASAVEMEFKGRTCTSCF